MESESKCRYESPLWFLLLIFIAGVSSCNTAHRIEEKQEKNQKIIIERLNALENPPSMKFLHPINHDPSWEAKP